MADKISLREVEKNIFKRVEKAEVHIWLQNQRKINHLKILMLASNSLYLMIKPMLIIKFWKLN